MGAPQYGEDTRADLQNTGLVYDQARGDSAASTLAGNLRGTESAQGLLKPDTQFNAQLGGADPMSDAITQKYQKQYGVQSRKFQHEETHQSEAQYFDKLAQAHDLVAKEQQANYQRRMEKYQQDQMRKRARGAVVGQVLGVVGAVVGAVYTGGTGTSAGAAAGYAVGSAVGGAVQGE